MKNKLNLTFILLNSHHYDFQRIKGLGKYQASVVLTITGHVLTTTVQYIAHEVG